MLWKEREELLRDGLPERSSWKKFSVNVYKTDVSRWHQSPLTPSSTVGGMLHVQGSDIFKDGRHISTSSHGAETNTSSDDDVIWSHLDSIVPAHTPPHPPQAQDTQFF